MADRTTDDHPADVRSVRQLSPETGETQEYRSFSVWSLVGLLLGLGSVTALIHPALWIVPVLALVCALLGVSETHPVRGARDGRALALAGLFLALLFVSWAPTWYIARRARVYGQARRHAIQWIDMVRSGRLNEAHQLQLPPEMRAPTEMTLEQFYSNEATIQLERDEYFRKQPLLALTTAPAEAPIRFLGNIKQFHHEREDFVRQLFEVTVDVNGQPVPLVVRMELKRWYNFRLEKDPCYWQVIEVGLVEEPAS